MLKKLLSAILIVFVMVMGVACSTSPENEDNNERNNDTNAKNDKFDNQYEILKLSLQSAKSNDVINGSNKFAFEFFKVLSENDKDENIFISPYSISAALSMAYNGSAGTTKQAMADALKYNGISDGEFNNGHKYLMERIEKADPKVEIDINNSIWIREGEEVKQGFIDINKKVFDAYVEKLDFSKNSAVDTINDWVDNATNGMIKKILDPPINSDVLMYLINTIYFKGEWTESFDKEKTYDTKFNNYSGGTSDIKMMNKKGSVLYGKGEDYKAVRIPYGDKSTSMYCILPLEDADINEFILSLDIDKFKEISGSIKEEEDVTLGIPRFKVEYGVREINDELISLGMGEAFLDSADFSGIRDNVFISKVSHKAVIEVDEQGTKAAAVTSVEITVTGVIEDPMAFIADRPFIYIIADDDDGTILFMGKIMDM